MNELIIREEVKPMDESKVIEAEWHEIDHDDEASESESEYPVWYDGKHLDEVKFCAEFLREHPMLYVSGRFYTVDGPVGDEDEIRKKILDKIKPVLTSGLAKTARNLLNALRIECWSPPLPVQRDRIHFANGTLMLDGDFTEEKDYCLNRLPIRYDPDTSEPVAWLRFLDELLYPEDIPTLQEYMGYCLIPSTKGQKMLVLKGKGGEGKSRIGLVMQDIFGKNMKNGSVAKVETSPFARADLEHELVMVDDDMKLGSEGYIAFEQGQTITAKTLYDIYCLWCEDNAFKPRPARSFGMYLIGHQEDYGVEYNNKVTNAQGRRVWGYWGIKPLVTPSL